MNVRVFRLVLERKQGYGVGQFRFTRLMILRYRKKSNIISINYLAFN